MVNNDFSLSSVHFNIESTVAFYSDCFLTKTFFFSDHVSEIRTHQESYLSLMEPHLKKKSLIQIQRNLVKCQEIGDEKLQIVAQIIEHIENRTRQLEQDLENLGKFTRVIEHRTINEKHSQIPGCYPLFNMVVITIVNLALF